MGVLRSRRLCVPHAASAAHGQVSRTEQSVQYPSGISLLKAGRAPVALSTTEDVAAQGSINLVRTEFSAHNLPPGSSLTYELAPHVCAYGPACQRGFACACPHLGR